MTYAEARTVHGAVATQSTPPSTPQRPSKSRLERGLLATALTAALIGVAVLVQMAVAADPPVSLETAASNGEMAARLDYYEWLEHDHGRHDHGDEGDETEIDGNVDPNPELQEGFARPSSMMPGTPDEGFVRLQIELHMENSAGQTTEVGPTDFWLEDDEGGWWPSLEGGTFRNTEISPGLALNTLLAFDVQDNRAEKDMEVVWIWNGEEIRFAATGSNHH